MAHGSELIDVAGGAAPVEYQLSGSEGLIPEAISAFFDGSGAAGEFRPCLELYAQSGELLSRTFPSETFAAGDSGEVTFAPFVRASASAWPGLASVDAYTASARTAFNGVVRADDYWDTIGLSGFVNPNRGFEYAPVGGKQRAWFIGAGWFMLSVVIEWTTSDAGARYVEVSAATMNPPLVRLNGSQTPDDDMQTLTFGCVGGPGPDRIMINVFQNSGADRQFNAWLHGTYFEGPGEP